MKKPYIMTISFFHLVTESTSPNVEAKELLRESNKKVVPNVFTVRVKKTSNINLAVVDKNVTELKNLPECCASILFIRNVFLDTLTPGFPIP